MLLRLGPSTFDVADRALVVAVLPPLAPEVVRGAAARAMADGADLVEVSGLAAGPDADVPVAVRTDDARVAREAFAAGALLALDPSGFADPGYLAVAVDAGASVVGAVAVDADADVVPVLRSLAARAKAAGLPPDQLAVEIVAAGGGRVPIPPPPALRCARVPVLLSLVRDRAGDEPDPAAVAGALSVAVVRGCGLLRVAAADVRSARRVADVIAAVRRGRP